ncbi:MAG TPA: hypothetical protein VF493_18360 [Terriglobales bacterium]
MKRASLLLAIACAFLILQVVAQGPKPGGQNSFRNYDPKTETTVSGTVQEVLLQSGGNRGTGTHVTLKTDDSTFDVHLGPTAYLEKEGLSLKKGDTIEVTGSKQNFNNTDVLIAREIKNSGKVFTLRDTQGRPAWSGRKTP